MFNNNNNNVYVRKGVHFKYLVLTSFCFSTAQMSHQQITRHKNIHDSAICCASQCTSDGQQFLRLIIG